MIKNHHFCVLWPFSWAIAYSFGVPGWFTRYKTLNTCLRSMTENSSLLCFRDVSVSYCPQFWGSVEIYKEYDSLYILERNAKKTHHFCVYGHFRELLPIVFRSRCDLQGPWHSVYFWEAWPRTRRFNVLGPFSWAIVHCFGVPGWFTWNMTFCRF
jgi:hypothetical protein